ncbi:DUF1592 domain-containing protein [Tautonia plasticadhaerens]|uniref:Planctomycete cytochrome C n=1 Tax=Tautonia plasticadhaerens TaxID=2527974 RepID=A0A518H3M4_9BACT|nr:DUF1592 domain-containing protein [Tautonia plasticadhaerens]QDV35465.1 hypothetical protein ElP_33680 [Tautonia plasticadhaerens]
MTRRGTLGYFGASIVLVAAGLGHPGERPGEADPGPPAGREVLERLARFSELHCTACHNAEDRIAGLALDELCREDLARDPDAWERVVKKLRARQMPPAGEVGPSGKTYDEVVSLLSEALDRLAAEHPDPGRTGTFRRLNRAEYRNAIRDLLALDVDTGAMLPKDESALGFDNVTVGDLSPTLLDRYITASQEISRLALGRTGRSPGGDTIRLRPDLTQERHVEGLPIGTRGGALIPYTFPVDGDYEIRLRLARDRNEHVEGLREPHEVEILLDRDRRASFTVSPPESESDHATADAHLAARVRVSAGPHQLGVTFVKDPWSLPETKRQPYQAHYNMHRHPRLSPALYQVTITGPYDSETPGDSPSRRRILSREPGGPDDEEPCARAILSSIMRRAYRRPVTAEDLETPMALFRQARAEGDFESGIELALSAILVSPHFLFRIETDPPGVEPGSAYRVPDVALASRLSFFLWSSIPDDELLDLADRGELHRPEVIRAQVRRMLADPKSSSLVENFAGQWLHLRNLESITPDLRLFPDFDDNLRQAFRRETELLFEEVLREDRSVLDLLESDHTYLNERLARHYGIPHVYGSRFRRVELGEDAERGGLLRHGSVLTVTSYATRTSPVIRGKWILENILGTPPPPPPPDVPTLEDNTVSASLSVRERLAQHRADDACMSCHQLMDPPGFALENFDAVGRWRDLEEGRPVDSAGGLPDGSEFEGVDGLERALVRRPELFVATLTEKLLTFALGRGVEPADAPAVRRVVHDARATDYRFSSLIEGIATSTPFLMRRAE